MKKAFAYARYSSDMQRQESIDAQLRAIRDFCETNHIIIIGIYTDEAQSATTDQREQFLNMISDASKSDIDYIIVHKLDRFSRNRYDSAIYKKELSKHGVKVLSVLEQLDDSPESVILEAVLEGMNEYYSKNLSREVKKGLHENALVAKHNGGTPPLGYNVKNGHYEINPFEAEAVKIIFQKYIHDVGYGEIIKELNNKGYRTKRNRPFGKNSIHDILINEKYTGTYVYNKRASKEQGNRVYKEDKDIVRIKDAIPRIISDQEFEAVQKKLNNHLHNPKTNSKHKYLLTGKIRCGLCGNAYTGNGYGKAGAKRYQYVCSTRKNNKTCNNYSISAEYIENVVIDLIKEKITPSLIDSLTAAFTLKLKEYQNETKDMTLINDYRNQLQSVKMKIDKTWDSYYEDDIGKDEFHERIKALNAKRDWLIEQIEIHEKEQKKIIPPSLLNAESLKAAIKEMLKDIDNNDSGIRQIIFNYFVKQVTLYKDEIKIDLKVLPISKVFTPEEGVCYDGGDEPNHTVSLPDVFTITVVIPRFKWFNKHAK